MLNRLRFLYKKTRAFVLNFYSKPNKNAIWIFGFQKSGTSAIAALFAEMAGKSVTIDSVYLWEPYKSKMEISGIGKHVNKYSFDFSRDIIKEPSATFYISTIESYFKLEKYIFIIRNPYDNIRSILNRLQLPGDKDYFDINNINPKWRQKFKNHGSNYIQDLAELWLQSNSQDYYMHSPRCILVKYEDFLKGKIEFIEGLIKEFNLEKKRDISTILDKPFQPKGDTAIDLIHFFGQKNIDVITRICDHKMEQLGYNKIEILKL